jgi:hypothetical protein
MIKKTILKTFLLLLIINNTGVQAQNAKDTHDEEDTIVLDFRDWPEQQVKRARETADSHIKCSNGEKEVIYYCNLVRINGPLFEKTILNQYLRESGYTEDGGYVESLREDLKKLPVNKLNLFAYDEKLFTASKKFATNGGKKGIVGHDGFDDRLKAFSTTNYCVAENCSYGLKDPLESFLMLLIDEGIEGVGHRKNILNSTFEYGSAAFAPHKNYRINMVMNFACGKMEN